MGKRIGVLISVIILILAGSFLIIKQSEHFKKEKIEKQPDQPEIIENNQPVVPEVKEPTIPETVNGLLIGFDRSKMLTDVIMVGHVDTKQNKVKVVSLPRDMIIRFGRQPFATIKKNQPKNKIGYCKINEIYLNMGHSQEGLDTLKEVVEELTGLKIDYVATVDIDGFKNIVDYVGGVEFDVPVRMRKHDPLQNLHINLKKGPQLLDGDHAEQLVRYRGYRTGDLRRIEIQQEFMRALYQKVVTTKDADQLTKVAKEILGMVEADFGLLVMSDYLDYFLTLKPEDILTAENMVTPPTWGIMVKNVSYQDFDLKKVRQTVSDLLADESENETENKTENKTKSDVTDKQKVSAK